MKCTVEQAALAEALGFVAGVAPSRGTIPILNTVKLTLGKNALTLAATDLDRRAEATAPTVSADEDGTGAAACVNAALLAGVVRGLPGGCEVEIEFDSAKNRLILRHSQSVFRFTTLEAATFPAFDSGAIGEVSFGIEGDALAGLLNSVRYAVSSEESRYYLCGVYLVAKKGKLHAVATNGHCLATAEIDIPEDAGSIDGIIIPTRTVAAIVEIAQAGGAVQIEVSAAKIRITAGTRSIFSRLIDGTFPDYQQVIPAPTEHRFHVDAAVLAGAVAQVSLLDAGDKKNRSRGAHIAATGGKLCISAAGDAGDGTAWATAQIEGEPAGFGVNAAYLRDTLSAAAGDAKDAAITIAVAGSDEALRVTTDRDAQWTAVIMPMTVAATNIEDEENGDA